MSKSFYGKSHLNLLRVFDLCLEMSSDSKNHFGFVVDELSELVHTIKSANNPHMRGCCMGKLMNK